MLEIQLARHFTAKDIPGIAIPNQFRHLHLPDAEKQAQSMRTKLRFENAYFSVRGHSTAPRACYSLLLSTIGVSDGSPIVQIPNLFPLDDADGKVIMAACGAKGLNPSRWEAEQQEALKRFGNTGAHDIREAIAAANVTEGQVIIFTHGPMINSQAAALAGGDDVTVARLFAIDTKEGDRFIIRGSEVTHVPLLD